MPLLAQAFDASQFDPTQGVGQMPLGKHPVIIEKSSIETNKAGDGGFLQLNLRIIDGPNKGGEGVYRLNLYNASPKAAEIAHRQMSALCHVTGVFRVQQSEQLHNIPFVVEVEPQKDNPQYTQVSRVYDMAGNEPGKAPQGQAGAQPQQQPQQFAPAPAPAPAAAPAAAWGAPAQQQPAAAPAPAAGGWNQAAPAAAGGQPAWGGGAAAPAPAAAPAAGGWQPQGGGAPAGGAAPWGAPR